MKILGYIVWLLLMVGCVILDIHSITRAYESGNLGTVGMATFGLVCCAISGCCALAGLIKELDR